MRNPRRDEVAKKITGVEPVIVRVPTWRQVNFTVAAVNQIMPAYGDDKGVMTFLENLGVTKLGWKLYEAAGRGGRELDDAIGHAVEFGLERLPMGPVATKADLEKLVRLYASTLANVKRHDVEKRESEVRRFSDKSRVFAQMQGERERLLKFAATASKALGASGEALDRLYDDAHGPYSSLLAYVAMRVPKAGPEAVVRSLRELFTNEGYPEISQRDFESFEASTRLMNAFELPVYVVGDVVLVSPYLTIVAPYLSKRFGAPVYECGQAAAFDKETWEAKLYISGELSDRHCSNPFALDEISEEIEGAADEAVVARLVQSWCGDPSRLAEGFGANEAQVRPYLLHFYDWELEEIWKDKPLFTCLKAFPDDRFSLAGPWAYLDLLSRLVGTRVGFHWELQGETLYFASRRG